MAETFLNNVIIVGRAGADAEIRYFDSGKAKASVSLAVNRYRAKGEDITDWFRVDFWERDAEIAAEYIKKGTQLLIEGRVSVNRWKDQSSGEERELYSIVCTSFRLLGSKKDSQMAEA